MGDPVVVESWHLPRALSDETLRFLTRLPMEEIERRLRVPVAADVEVAKLVATLRIIAVEADRACQFSDADVITCAANLLERQAAAAPVARLPEDAQVIEPANRTILAPIPAPIPVSERLPGPEDCDTEERCWFYTPACSVLYASWVLREPDSLRKWETHWLPAHALPLPEVE